MFYVVRLLAVVNSKKKGYQIVKEIDLTKYIWLKCNLVKNTKYHNL